VHITICSAKTLIFHWCKAFVAGLVTVEVPTKNTNGNENKQRYCSRPSGDGSVGNEQRQGITLCTCNWKRSNTTAIPCAQVTMKTASKRFSTTACLKPV